MTSYIQVESGDEEFESALEDQVEQQRESNLETELLEFDDLKFADLQVARNIYHQLRDDAFRRRETFAFIKASYDGNAPYDSSEIDAGRFNINPRFMAKTMRDLRLNSESVLTHSKTYIDFNYDVPDLPDSRVLEANIEYQYNELMNHWPGFKDTFRQMDLDRLLYGAGLLYWPNPKDFRYEAFDYTRVLWPEDTSTIVDDWTLVFAEHKFTFHELYKEYKKAKNGGNSLWSAEALEDVLEKMTVSGDGETRRLPFADFELDLQDRIAKNSDLCRSINTDHVQVVSVFWKRLNGKIAHGIFTRDLDTNDYLFFSKNRYDAFSQAFCLVPRDDNVRTVHELKGYGHLIYNFVVTATRLYNSVLDAGIRGSTVFMQTMGADRRRDIREDLVDLGGLVLTEHQVQTNGIRTNLQDLIVLLQKVLTDLFDATAIAGLEFVEKHGDGRGFELVKLQLSKNARVHKHEMNFFLDRLTDCYRETMRKIYKSVDRTTDRLLQKKFFGPLILRGIGADFFTFDDEADSRFELPSEVNVYANKPSGTGSQQADALVIQELAPIAGSLGTQGFRNYLERVVISAAGPDEINQFLPEEDFKNQPTRQSQQAVIESNQLQDFSVDLEDPNAATANKPLEIPVTRDDDHLIHAQVHLEEIAKTIQGFQRQQINLLEADVRLTNLVSHEAQHIALLDAIPEKRDVAGRIRNEFNNFFNELKSIRVNSTRMRERMIKEQQEAEALKAQGGMESDDPKVIKARGDVALKAQKQQAELTMLKQRTDFENLLEASKFQLKRDIDIAQAQVDARIRLQQERREIDKQNEKRARSN